jgi:hypothetical protein
MSAISNKILAILLIAGMASAADLEELRFQAVASGDMIQQLAIIITDDGVHAPYRLLCPNCTATAEIWRDGSRYMGPLTMTQSTQAGVFETRADQRYPLGAYELRANVSSPDYGSELVISQFIIEEPKTSLSAVLPGPTEACVPDGLIAESLLNAPYNTYKILAYVASTEGIGCLSANAGLNVARAIKDVPVIGGLWNGFLMIIGAFSGLFTLLLITIPGVIGKLINVIFIDKNSLFMSPSGFMSVILIPWFLGLLWSLFEIAGPFVMLVEMAFLGYCLLTEKDNLKMSYKWLHLNLRAVAVLSTAAFMALQFTRSAIETILRTLFAAVPTKN